MRFIKIQIEGFRVFQDREEIDLDANPNLCFGYGENTRGKTSFAEAIEFLLCGKTSRRDLCAVTKSEFAAGLANVHYNGDTIVQAQIEHPDQDDSPRQVEIRRRLVSDYPDGNDDCASQLERKDENGAWVEFSFEEIGLPDWSEPVSLPMIFQHTLRHVCWARPIDRRDYFRKLLDIADITTLRDMVRRVAERLSSISSNSTYVHLLEKVGALGGVECTHGIASVLNDPTPPSGVMSTILVDAMRALLAEAGQPSDREQSDDVIVQALREAVDRSRDEVSELPALSLPVLGEDWTPPPSWEEPWTQLSERLAEKKGVYDSVNEVLEQQVQALVAFLREGVRLPTFAAEFSGRKNCPFCLTPEAVSWERLCEIREALVNPEEIQTARTGLANVLQEVSDRLLSLNSAVEAQLTPDLAELDPASVEPYAESIPETYTEWAGAFVSLKRCAARLRRLLERAQSDLVRLRDAAETGQVVDTTTFTNWVARLRRRAEQFAEKRSIYCSVEERLTPAVNEKIDELSGRANWSHLMDLWDHRDRLREALVDRCARTRVKHSLALAAEQIASANADVLTHDKFPNLTTDIQTWWQTLRPEAGVNFSRLVPEGRGLRQIDIKASLALGGEDSSGTVERDALAVFSDSELNCLGLSIFLARTQRDNPGFVLLDDPIQSLDREHAHFLTTNVVARLANSFNTQVIVLTHDNEFWEDLKVRYAHEVPKGFYVTIDEEGKAILEDMESRLSEVLKLLGRVVATADPAIAKLAVNRLRIGAEVFCKEVIARFGSAIEGADLPSHFEGRMLPELLGKATPYLSEDPSHRGKIEFIERRTNPGSHDDPRLTPDTAAFRAMVAELKALARCYRVG